jgi:hypothetical protein
VIAIPGNVRVWLATGHTDMRRCFRSLALMVQVRNPDRQCGDTGWRWASMHIYHVASGAPVSTILRPARIPKGTKARTVIKRVTKHLWRHWPSTRIVWRCRRRNVAGINVPHACFAIRFAFLGLLILLALIVPFMPPLFSRNCLNFSGGTLERLA